MQLPPDLERRLDNLEAQLPTMVEDNPDPGDFWMAFASQADPIEDEAGEHTEAVMERIQEMLARHGRYIAMAS